MARSHQPRPRRLPEPLEVRQHPVRTLALLAMSLVMTALGVVVAVVDTPWGDVAVVAGWLGAAAFGAASGYVLWRMVTVRGPVIALSDQGLHDTRVTHAVVPWSEITGAGTWEYQRQKVMVLAVRPDAWDRLPLTRAARWSREPNRKLGADGLAITTTGLTVGHDELLAATRAWIAATH